MNRKRHTQGWLRTLRQALYHHRQEARRSLADIWRAPFASLLTLAVIGVSLALPATFWVMLQNTSQVTSQWQEGGRITLFLHKSVNDSGIAQLTEQLKGDPAIASVRYISPEAGMKEFAALSGFEDALSLLSQNPLPPVLELVPAEAQRTAEAAEQLLARLSDLPEVEQAKLDLQWLGRLNRISGLIRHALLSFGGLMLIGVLLTVANTMRLNILGRRAEIEVMKLVGATDAFIQRPFLYMGLWYGLIGGMLAWWLTEVLVLWSEAQVQALAALYHSDFRLTGLGLGDSLGLLLLSALLGVVAAMISVWRHIRQIEPANP